MRRVRKERQPRSRRGGRRLHLFTAAASAAALASLAASTSAIAAEPLDVVPVSQASSAVAKPVELGSPVAKPVELGSPVAKPVELGSPVSKPPAAAVTSGSAQPAEKSVAATLPRTGTLTPLPVHVTAPQVSPSTVTAATPVPAALSLARGLVKAVTQAAAPPKIPSALSPLVAEPRRQVAETAKPLLGAVTAIPPRQPPAAALPKVTPTDAVAAVREAARPVLPPAPRVLPPAPPVLPPAPPVLPPAAPLEGAAAEVPVLAPAGVPDRPVPQPASPVGSTTVPAATQRPAPSTSSGLRGARSARSPEGPSRQRAHRSRAQFAPLDGSARSFGRPALGAARPASDQPPALARVAGSRQGADATALVERPRRLAGAKPSPSAASSVAAFEAAGASRFYGASFERDAAHAGASAKAEAPRAAPNPRQAPASPPSGGVLYASPASPGALTLQLLAVIAACLLAAGPWGLRRQRPRGRSPCAPLCLALLERPG